MQKILILYFALFLLYGCESNASAIVPAPTGYEVDEWGLIDIKMDGQVQLQTIPQTRHPVAPRAPILYFHLIERSTMDIRVKVNSHGRVTEHWPEASLTNGQITWAPLHLSRNSCQGVYPNQQSVHCRNTDECEAALLQAAETRDSACIDFQNQNYNHLFYRSQIPSFEMPVLITKDATGFYVENRSISSSYRNAWRVTRRHGSLYANMIYIQDRARRTAIPPSLTGEVSVGRDNLRRLMRSTGISDQSTNAFFRVWENDLFGDSAFDDSLLFVLSPELTDRISTLEFEPRPLRVNRAHMVRIKLE